MKNERKYTNGKIDGTWVSYYENGKIKEQGTYEENLKEGVRETFYTNGKVRERGKYIFDNKVDDWTINYYDGQFEDK